MLLDMKRSKEPKGYDEVKDHNSGVALWRSLGTYLRSHPKTVQHFKTIAMGPEVAALMAEAEEARRKWSENRSADRTWFEKMSRLESFEFAESKAMEIMGGGTDAGSEGAAVH
jgi:hypothetical protein